MAQRTLQQIIDQIKLYKLGQSDLDDLNSTSQTSIWGLWIYIQAMGQYLVETIIGVKQAEIEVTVSKAISPSDAWLQKKVLEFQYSATTPQIVQLVDFIPTYNPIDTSLRIITRASVKTSGQRIVNVKVAKSDPPVPLSGPELSALQGYLTQGGDGTVSGAGTGIAYAGVQINAISEVSDKLYMKATVNYNGQYSAVIQANVIAAINTFLASIPFDGVFKVLGLVDAIQAVPGVTDLYIEDLAARPDATAFGSGSNLISSFTQNATSYQTFAGYIVEEDTAGETFTDKLTFVAS